MNHSDSHGTCRRRSSCPVAATCPAADSTHHFHLPDSASSMTPQQLNALAGQKPIGDIEDLIAPRAAPRALPAQQRGAAGIFDPEIHAETRRPLLNASTLEAGCYTDPEWFDEEQDMLGSGWTIVGRVDEVPEQGNFLTVRAQATRSLPVSLGLFLRGCL